MFKKLSQVFVAASSTPTQALRQTRGRREAAASSVTSPVECFIRRVQITGLLDVRLHCLLKSADYIQPLFGFWVSDRSPSPLFVDMSVYQARQPRHPVVLLYKNMHAYKCEGDLLYIL